MRIKTILIIYCQYFLITVGFVQCSAEKESKLWHQDMTNDIQIGPADSGYKKVTLKCFEEEKIMQVHIEMEEKFDGVIYTRGSFYKQETDCFLKVKPGRRFKMRIPFDRCNTTKDGNTYKNIIVIQYDDELIMPGDAAFALECDLGPRDVIVNADMTSTNDAHVISSMESRISLADADPAGKPLPKHRQSTVYGQGSVTFTPDDVRPRRKKKKKEEL